jgi:glycosyltransferase involved in cell wall biosynthesis
MEKNRVLIVSNYFYPEEFKINEIAFELSVKGFEVSVITGIPNYPVGKFFKGYGIFQKNTELYKGVKIIRLPQIPRGNGSKIRLIINYLSFFISLSFYSLYISFFKKYDIIFVHHVSPIFLGIPSLIIKKIQGIKMIFWNLDLWPEAVSYYLKKNWMNKQIIKFLNLIVKFIYSNSDKLLISSKSFKNHAIIRGVSEKNIIYFPNWAEEIYTSKSENLIVSSDYNFPPNSFKIMFAGNIGEGQDMNSVLKAIEHTYNIDKNICWIIVGDGRMKTWIENQVKMKKLDRCVKFLGRHPVELMPSFFRLADAMLLPLLDGSVYSSTVPAKLQAYMASRKPVLAMINGEAATVIKESKCGLVTNSGNYIQLSKNVLKMKNNIDDLDYYSQNSYKYYKENYSKQKTINKLVDVINKL